MIIFFGRYVQLIDQFREFWPLYITGTKTNFKGWKREFLRSRACKRSWGLCPDRNIGSEQFSVSWRSFVYKIVKDKIKFIKCIYYLKVFFISDFTFLYNWIFPFLYEQLLIACLGDVKFSLSSRLPLVLCQGREQVQKSIVHGESSLISWDL